ncbi:MAG: hypothetical protein IEMM0008_0361 [bacterium]|nr:MAG: hypothetical protein IEMM0008_0361 [bacterium]
MIFTKVNLYVTLLIAGLILTGCDKKQDKKKSDAWKKASTQSKDKDKIPFNYPIVKSITAQKGDYVLVPLQSLIEKGFEIGGNKIAFVWYAAQMVESGEGESRVKLLTGQEMTIPNSLILRIKQKEKAKLKDIVLTWHKSKKTMQRAYVAGIDNGKTLLVHYLDDNLNNPGILRQPANELLENTYYKLNQGMKPGTSVICRDRGSFKHGTLIHRVDGKIMLAGFAGKISIHPENQCTPLPVNLAVRPGDTIYFPYFGQFIKGKVVSILHHLGQYLVEHKFGGKTKREKVPFGDVIKSLPESKPMSKGKSLPKSKLLAKSKPQPKQ